MTRHDATSRVISCHIRPLSTTQWWAPQGLKLGYLSTNMYKLISCEVRHCKTRLDSHSPWSIQQTNRTNLLKHGRWVGFHWLQTMQIESPSDSESKLRTQTENICHLMLRLGHQDPLGISPSSKTGPWWNTIARSHQRCALNNWSDKWQAHNLEWTMRIHSILDIFVNQVAELNDILWSNAKKKTTGRCSGTYHMALS